MSISFIASGVVWAWLMNPATGDRLAGINLMFHLAHLDFLISKWFTNPQPWAWHLRSSRRYGNSRLYHGALLGGIRSISDDLREAARVDGASEFQIYRYIILPLLQPVT